jgi:hypothetical protein
MNFRIADTFTDSLARLSGDEQKSVKTTAFDLQVNPASPGMRFHRLDRAKDPNFWSVRVNDGIRLIVHKTGEGLLLCYVGQHDEAYRWAERRKIERHPKTGAAQLVEVRETVREIAVPRYVEAPVAPSPTTARRAAFVGVSDEELLSFGVPPEWLKDVREATEDSLLDLCEHLPREASEALLDLATGAKPKVQQLGTATSDPFAHPDAQRRFRVMTNVEELERALEYPWEKWTVFLHPAQRDVVERRYSGPVRVAGSAGTGKTIVALHRAVRLARMHPTARVLLTTFSPTLAGFLRLKLGRLVGNERGVVERIEVSPLSTVAERVFTAAFGSPRVADDPTVDAILRTAAGTLGVRQFPERFMRSEWREVVDAWGIESWEEYRDVQRLGRKTRLSEPHRKALWSVFEAVRAQLGREKQVTVAGIALRAAAAIMGGAPRPFDFAVVDESQDVSVAQLKLLSVLTTSRADGLFFAGDLGQRIFQTPFSWKSLGVDIRGRSYTLRINYRPSHQIRRQADRLLPPEVSDVDGNAEQRRGAVSVFNGPDPEIVIAESIAAEERCIADWIRARKTEGVRPDEIGIFVRSDAELTRAAAAVRASGEQWVQLDTETSPTSGKISISTMHLAKGLEFRAVVVAAVDDGVLPLEERIEAVSDEADLEEVYNTERHLLYVACTRARDRLLVTGVKPGSEFLGDIQ